MRVDEHNILRDHLIFKSRQIFQLFIYPEESLYPRKYIFIPENMSTQTGKIGNKGEMYLPVSIRNEMGLQPGTRVKFIVLHNNKLYIERIPAIEDLLNQKPLMKVSVEEIEKLSEKMQSKMIEEA